jgi:hypothetical protein
MPLDDRLEHYLARLDRALTAISISDRADIVTEIKSHVLSALDREPKPSMDSVLAALGEPEIVANHYLLERGLKPGKPPVSPIVKWIVIGFLGTLATFVILIALLLKAAGPVIKVSDKEDRVTLLGGFIDIDGKKGTVKIGDSFIDSGNAKTDKFQGSAPAKSGDKLSVKFSNGSIIAESGTEWKWDCRGALDDKPEPTAKAGTIDFSAIDHLRCSLTFPKGVNANIEGTNGKIQLDKPEFNLEASLDNGKATVTPQDGTKYGFDFTVHNGKISAPPSDANPDYKLRIQLGNGKITVEGKE